MHLLEQVIVQWIYAGTRNTKTFLQCVSKVPLTTFEQSTSLCLEKFYRKNVFVRKKQFPLSVTADVPLASFRNSNNRWYQFITKTLPCHFFWKLYIASISSDTEFNCHEYFVKASILWLHRFLPDVLSLYVVINSPSPATIFYKSTFRVVFNKSSALHETLNLFHWLENQGINFLSIQTFPYVFLSCLKSCEAEFFPNDYWLLYLAFYSWLYILSIIIRIYV